MAALSGARASGATNYLPLTGFWGIVDFTVEGQPAPAPGQRPEADSRLATPGYMESMQIPIVRGRAFTDADREDTPHVAIVNATLARRLWGDADPIGARLNLGDTEPDLWEVVGVVGDVRAFGAGTEIHAELYRPFTQASFPLIAFTVRTEGAPAALSSGMRAAIRQVDPDLPVTISTLETLAAESLATRRVSAQVVTVFGALALLMASLGIYGVMSHAVSRRTQELGVRMALGAGRRDLLLMVMRQGLQPALIGLAVGLAGAFALTRWLESLLYGVRPGDPAILSVACVILIGVAALACYLPARRASQVNPMTAIRDA
jgi:putative ABC transport system permease protein